MLNENTVAADKTTVTVEPQSQQINIVQDNLFTVIHKDENVSVVEAPQAVILSQVQKDASWANDMSRFTDKDITFSSQEGKLDSHITLTYQNAEDLRAFGVWYNAEKNQFSINHVPDDNLQTENGQQLGNYWVFDGDSTFSFTLEPFAELPAHYQKTYYQDVDYRDYKISVSEPPMQK